MPLRRHRDRGVTRLCGLRVGQRAVRRPEAQREGERLLARRHLVAGVDVEQAHGLQQRARPSLFSNALPATVACSARKAIEIVEREPQRVAKLHQNVAALRTGLARLGFECPASPTAIIPIMIGDEPEALAKGNRLLELGVLVVGFAYPVVPQGQARLRLQASAALEPEHLERALDAFAKL